MRYINLRLTYLLTNLLTYLLTYLLTLSNAFAKYVLHRSVHHALSSESSYPALLEVVKPLTDPLNS